MSFVWTRQVKGALITRKTTLRRAQRTSSPSRRQTWEKWGRSPLATTTKAPQLDGLWTRWGGKQKWSERLLVSEAVLKTFEMVVGALVPTCTHTHTHITYTHCRHPSLWVKWNHVPLRYYLTSNGQVIYTLLQVFFSLTPHSSMLCFLKPFMLHWYNQGLLLVLCAFCNNHFLRLLLKLCTESSIGCKIVVIFLSGDFRWSGKQNGVWISH